jgi:hypothetical protein
MISIEGDHKIGLYIRHQPPGGLDSILIYQVYIFIFTNYIMEHSKKINEIKNGLTASNNSVIIQNH